MRKTRYPVSPRANLVPGFWGCSFCRGAGCLACDGESNRKYKEQFPDGPKPMLTIHAQYDGDLATMQDEGCPNVDQPTFFPKPEGDDLVSEATRRVIDIIGTLQGLQI